MLFIRVFRLLCLFENIQMLVVSLENQFSSPYSPTMEGIIDLYDYIMYFLILIFFFVFWLFSYIIYKYIFLLNASMYLRTLAMLDWSEVFFFFYESLTQLENLLTSKAFSAYMGLKVLSFEHYYRDARQLLLYRNYTHNEIIEIIWTIVPAIVLVLIAIPSFTLLYAMDEVIDVAFVVKIIGYQWFWNYEYSGGFTDIITLDEDPDVTYYLKERTIMFSSVMLTEEDLWFGGRRLLEVDHPLVLPEGVNVRLLVTSGDVLHSWALPNFGIKIDAVPGRLSQVSFYSYLSGTFYGQCSELCGVGHGFMPISVWVLPEDKFFSWWWQALEERVSKPESSIDLEIKELKENINETENNINEEKQKLENEEDKNPEDKNPGDDNGNASAGAVVVIEDANEVASADVKKDEIKPVEGDGWDVNQGIFSNSIHPWKFFGFGEPDDEKKN